MKKLIICIIIIFNIGNAFAGPTITKTASVSSAFIGDQFEYTITISGFSNLNELNSIVDNLGSDLQYISSDITTTPLMSVYGIFCSSVAVPTLTVSSSNILTVSFPSGCSASVTGTFSFKIKVKVKESACALKGGTLTNVITLNSTSGVTNASSTISIESGVPWKLQKNYIGFTAGIFEYDVRLNSTYGGYSSQVLFSTGSSPMFTDTFFLPSCFTASNVDIPSTTVDYIEETSMAIFGTAENLTKTYNAALHAVILTWDLPPISFTSGRTFNAYFYKIKIKTIWCPCGTTIFDVNNKVYFNASDQCSTPINLVASAIIKNLQCSGITITVPSKDTLCVQKESNLGSLNSLNLFMPGCNGEFIIKIVNCSNFAKFSNISFTDFAPSNISFGTPSYTGPGTPSFLGSNSTQVVFNYSTPSLSPGSSILTIRIPFTVSSTFPSDIKLINCVTVNATGANLITGLPIFISKTVCDSTKKSIPLATSPFLEKKLCNSSLKSCGGFTSNDFMPNDTAIYMLHFFNYGTSAGTDLKLSDVIPIHLTIANPATDIRVFKYYGGTWDVMGTCDTAMASNINSLLPISTSSSTPSSISFNNTSNLLQINFPSAHNLDGFTCSGITHYFVRIKTKIKATAPDGIYNNAFKIDYKDPTAKSAFSNTVSLTVNNDNMLVYGKSIFRSTSNCDKQQDTVEYEIKIANLSQVAIAYNIKDQITLPAGVTLTTGIHNLKYCVFTTGTSCTPTASFTSPTITPTSFMVANQILNPCQVIFVRYKVIYNTGALTPGIAFGKNVCNTVTIEAGYPEWVYNNWDATSLPTILLSKNSDLIDGYLSAKTNVEKQNFRKLMKVELPSNNSEAKKMYRGPGITYTLGYYTLTFTPFIYGTDSKCFFVSSCLNGVQKGCFNNISNPVTFKIDSINKFGQVFTKFVIGSAPKINRIEYILSDIRMVETCPLSGFPRIICSPCTKNLTGFFTNTSSVVLGSTLGSTFTGFPPNPFPVANNYREKNIVTFSNTSYENLSGFTDSRRFQLPIASLNCGGRLELVITVIIHYENCTVCYISDAHKYNAYRTWDISSGSSGTVSVLSNNPLSTNSGMLFK